MQGVKTETTVALCAPPCWGWMTVLCCLLHLLHDRRDIQTVALLHWPSRFLKLKAWVAFGLFTLWWWWWWDRYMTLFYTHNLSKFLLSCTGYNLFFSIASPWRLLRVLLLLFPCCSFDRDVPYCARFCGVSFLCAPYHVVNEKRRDCCSPSINIPLRRGSWYTRPQRSVFYYSFLSNVMWTIVPAAWN